MQTNDYTAVIPLAEPIKLGNMREKAECTVRSYKQSTWCTSILRSRTLSVIASLHYKSMASHSLLMIALR